MPPMENMSLAFHKTNSQCTGIYFPHAAVP